MVIELLAVPSLPFWHLFLSMVFLFDLQNGFHHVFVLEHVLSFVFGHGIPEILIFEHVFEFLFGVTVELY